VRHGTAVEPAVRVAATFVHPDLCAGPNLGECSDRSVRVLEGEPALQAEHRAPTAPRAERRDHGADVAATDVASLIERQYVAGEHVDPAQPSPSRRPNWTLTVIGQWVGHLVDAHETPPD